MEVKIKSKAAAFIIEAAKSAFPREFIGLLKPDSHGNVKEIHVFPGSQFNHFSSSVDFLQVPIASGYLGSIHSHPSKNNNPSKQDIFFFSRYGSVHLIICYPFTLETIAAYNSQGNRIPFQVCE